jgi:hypothetical protein
MHAYTKAYGGKVIHGLDKVDEVLLQQHLISANHLPGQEKGLASGRCGVEIIAMLLSRFHSFIHLRFIRHSSLLLCNVNALYSVPNTLMYVCPPWQLEASCCGVPMLCGVPCSMLFPPRQPTSRRSERCIFQKDSTFRASLTHHRPRLLNFELVRPKPNNPWTRLVLGSGRPTLMMLPLTSFLLPTLLLH